ncbi:AraC family transcriptional regulator [Curtobacterium sp. MCBA15_001]|uniref:helix-turn-helix transcriptional regulator n=1 Tax=Curtobacterium sp. MCBA15_001 TaxID=1898731 RepID=UPI0008DE5E1D|nr:hypothetical protein BIU90_16865 [Curtobacterium sp. MCBA15_001]
MHGYLRGDVAVEGEIVVQWLERGRARVDVGGDEVRMRPGIPVMYPIERRFEMEYEDWDQRLVHVSDDLVRDVASARYILSGPLSFDRSAVPTSAAVHRWRSAVAGSVRSLRQDGPASLAWSEAKRDVARALLELYPLQAESVSPGCGDRNGRRLRAAVEYIREHAQEPLAVADIARAVDVSVRTLQDVFQRDFRVCATTFVREVRLDGAHEELAAARHDDVLVADVARRWGFAHLGRFSAAYAARFGEYPRETLRR